MAYIEENDQSQEKDPNLATGPSGGLVSGSSPQGAPDQSTSQANAANTASSTVSITGVQAPNTDASASTQVLKPVQAASSVAPKVGTPDYVENNQQLQVKQAASSVAPKVGTPDYIAGSNVSKVTSGTPFGLKNLQQEGRMQQAAVKAPPAQKTAEQKASGSWTNLNQYLKGNAGSPTSGKIAEKIEGQVGQAREQLKTGATGLAQKALQGGIDVNKDLIEQGINVAGKSGADNEKLYKNLEAYKAQAETGYQGPKDLSELKNLSDIQNAYKQSKERADLTSTEAGRFALLSDMFGRPDYSTGAKRLDQLLIQNDPQARARFEALRSLSGEAQGDVTKAKEQFGQLSQLQQQRYDAVKNAIQRSLRNQGYDISNVPEELVWQGVQGLSGSTSGQNIEGIVASKLASQSEGINKESLAMDEQIKAAELQRDRIGTPAWNAEQDALRKKYGPSMLMLSPDAQKANIQRQIDDLNQQKQKIGANTPQRQIVDLGNQIKAKQDSLAPLQANVDAAKNIYDYWHKTGYNVGRSFTLPDGRNVPDYEFGRWASQVQKDYDIGKAQVDKDVADLSGQINTVKQQLAQQTLADNKVQTLASKEAVIDPITGLPVKENYAQKAGVEGAQTVDAQGKPVGTVIDKVYEDSQKLASTLEQQTGDQMRAVNMALFSGTIDGNKNPKEFEIIFGRKPSPNEKATIQPQYRQELINAVSRNQIGFEDALNPETKSRYLALAKLVGLKPEEYKIKENTQARAETALANVGFNAKEADNIVTRINQKMSDQIKSDIGSKIDSLLNSKTSKWGPVSHELDMTLGRYKNVINEGYPGRSGTPYKELSVEVADKAERSIRDIKNQLDALSKNSGLSYTTSWAPMTHVNQNDVNIRMELMQQWKREGVPEKQWPQRLKNASNWILSKAISRTINGVVTNLRVIGDLRKNPNLFQGQNTGMFNTNSRMF